MKNAVFILLAGKLIPRYQLMARKLKQEGWNIVVVSWDKGEISQFIHDQNYIDNWISIRMVSTGMTLDILRNLPSFYKQVREELKELGHIDLILLTHILLLPLSSLKVSCVDKCIYDVSEFYHLEMGMRYRPLVPFVRVLLFGFEYIYSKRVDAILIVDSLKSFLLKRYLKLSSNVKVIFNVPSQYDEPNEQAKKFESSKDHGKKIIAYVGGLSVDRGLDKAIEAADIVRRRYPDVIFRFIGPWISNQKSVLETIKQKKLENNVEFIEPVAYSLMIAKIHSAIVALAVHQDAPQFKQLGIGNGRKNFSYMQAGIPVIAPGFGKIGFLVKEYDYGKLIDTASANEIAKAVIYYIENPKDARRQAKNSRKLFDQKYNWERESEKFMSVVNSLVN